MAVASGRCPTAASTTCGSASATHRLLGSSTRRSRRTPGFASPTTSRITYGFPALTSRSHSCATGVHLAFSADENATVQAFHGAAIDAGYRDNGAPGERPVYHAGYYGAFVLDPDGHNIEVVNHHG